MAEIKIERKKNNSVWIWLLVVVLLALLAWAIYEFAFDQEEVETLEQVPATGMILPENWNASVA